jgi:hypothetical protein
MRGGRIEDAALREGEPVRVATVVAVAEADPSVVLRVRDHPVSFARVVEEQPERVDAATVVADLGVLQRVHVIRGDPVRITADARHHVEPAAARPRTDATTTAATAAITTTPRAPQPRATVADEPIALDDARRAPRSLSVRPRCPDIAGGSVDDGVAVGLHLEAIGRCCEAGHRRPARVAVLI